MSPMAWLRRDAAQRQGAVQIALHGPWLPSPHWRAAEFDQPCFWSKNCSSSVEPFKAPVEAKASMVVVTASK